MQITYEYFLSSELNQKYQQPCSCFMIQKLIFYLYIVIENKYLSQQTISTLENAYNINLQAMYITTIALCTQRTSSKQ